MRGVSGSASSPAATGRRSCCCTASAGPPGTSLLWPGCSRAAASSCRTCRATAARQPLPAPSLAGFADVVAGLLDEPAAVFGHSMGGVVALRLAERHPELVRSARAGGPGGHLELDRGSARVTIGLAGIVQPGRIAGRARHSGRPLGAAQAARLRAARGLERRPALTGDRARLPAGHHDAHRRPRCRARPRARRPATQAFSAVACPTLVLFGARDRQVPLQDGFEYARRLRAPLRVIADCGHLLIGERPDVCARAALDFSG